MIRGVCFDMDGLLFDTERMGAEVMDQAAALQGCSLTEEQWRSVIGQSLAATQTALRSWFGQRIDPQRFVDDWCRLMLERVRKDGMPLMPGAREALEMLRRRGVATALVTSNGQAVVREYLAISGFAPYFDQVITGEMTQRSKPAPRYLPAGGKAAGTVPGGVRGGGGLGKRGEGHSRGGDDVRDGTGCGALWPGTVPLCGCVP